MKKKLKQPKLQANQATKEIDVFIVELSNENDTENEEDNYYLLCSNEHDE